MLSNIYVDGLSTLSATQELSMLSEVCRFIIQNISKHYPRYLKHVKTLSTLSATCRDIIHVKYVDGLSTLSKNMWIHYLNNSKNLNFFIHIFRNM